MVTIFTPTYNRAYILPKLYESLCSQTSSQFEWIVVDDGSEDNTLNLLENWSQEQKLNMRYYIQENGGKHRAINNAINKANGELFFIVDSDDYLTCDAVESIYNYYNKIRNKSEIGGICFRKINKCNNTIIGPLFPKKCLCASSLEIHYKMHIYGDKAEVFRTELLRSNLFPEIDNEKFFTEAYIWNKVTDSHKLYLVNKGIYICEYLDDGLTRNFNNILRKNPRGYITYYKSLYHYPIVWTSPIDILKISVRLVQCYFYKLL